MSDNNPKNPEDKAIRNILVDFDGNSSSLEEQLQGVLEKSAIRNVEGPLSPLMKGVPVFQEQKKEKTGVKLAFYEDPVETSNYSGLWKTKRRLLPDRVIKLIRVQNHLVASILRARGNMMSMHGHKRKDRFDIGFEISIKPEFEQYVKEDQKIKIQERIERLEKQLLNCGNNEGLSIDEHMSLSEFLNLQAKNGESFGRHATEIIYEEGDNKKRKFHSFRPVDAGTIYNIVRNGEFGAQAIREASIARLQAVTGDKINIDMDMLREDKYSYIQDIEGAPVQAFAADELIVYNMYPSTDIEHAGYPVTPIDTCISAITTHLSIDAYNRLYFQNGRAAKGILVVKSNEIDQATIQKIRQDFMASINNVNNSFRAPVFGVNPEDDVQWLPMVSSAGDGEFQFLYDQVARNILATFNMSPDELPGYGHLSRGTNQQSLSESSNEFKISAAKDTGLRPLVLKFQSFFNEKLLPIMDPELAQICVIRLAGLDAQTREQESLMLQQDMPIHMTYDEVLGDVDKNPIGERLGGNVPFNERLQVILDKYKNVGELREAFMGDVGALLDPLQQFPRDAFYFQNLQIAMQANPLAVQALYASKPYAFDLLRMMVQDQVEEETE